jgi:hypothetical protein
MEIKSEQIDVCEVAIDLRSNKKGKLDISEKFGAKQEDESSSSDTNSVMPKPDTTTAGTEHQI